MRKSIFPFILTFVFLWSCNRQSKTPTEMINPDAINTKVIEDGAAAHDKHIAQSSLDWAGVYKGITPCADCSGIETAIELKKDFTYSLKMKYLGKAEEPVFEDQGTFTWDKDGTTIIFSGKGASAQKYFVGENTLTQLDMDGNRIEGKSADLYILKK